LIPSIVGQLSEIASSHLRKRRHAIVIDLKRRLGHYQTNRAVKSLVYTAFLKA
jgi:hypothetical protein